MNTPAGIHAYPFKAIFGDYARAGAGLVLAATPLLLPEPLAPLVLAGLMAVLAVFLIYGWRTALRHVRRITVDEVGISATAVVIPGFGRTIKWADLERVKLSYYSTRRDKTEGWLQLNLTDGRATMNIQSSLDGFAEIAGKAARIASGKNISLDAATVENYSLLGIPLENIPAGEERL